ncbi:MAG: glycosyltransferase family 4 protein [Candidatus Competibacterales bacterium]|nr:glycosyltransferase family 4 protein [Candidatus Competibacterales bacterium]
MTALHFLLPGDPDSRTGGYRYDARILAGLAARGWTVHRHRLDASFPHPTAEALDQAARVLAALPDNARVMIDGLAGGALPGPLRTHAERLRLVLLVHHPLALETGLDHDRRARLYDSERAALAAARRVIVTSPHTRRALADYGVAAERIGVVVPGTNPAPLAQGSDWREPRLLCVASLTPRKGHETLFRALAQLAGLPWRLRCVGGAHYHPETAARLEQLSSTAGLAGRIELAGEYDDEGLARAYDEADLFVLASHYEGYGMVLSEALARGLPVVATTGGAIPDTVPPDAGFLVPPGDPHALAMVLRRVLTDPGLRQQLQAGARAARAALPDWPAAAARMADELDRVG